MLSPGRCRTRCANFVSLLISVSSHSRHGADPRIDHTSPSPTSTPPTLLHPDLHSCQSRLRSWPPTPSTPSPTATHAECRRAPHLSVRSGSTSRSPASSTSSASSCRPVLSFRGPARLRSGRRTGRGQTPQSPKGEKLKVEPEGGLSSRCILPVNAGVEGGGVGDGGGGFSSSSWAWAGCCDEEGSSDFSSSPSG